MIEFGQPARNATTDANAGVVNPPATKQTARQLATPTAMKSPTALEEGIGGVGLALGKALQSRLTEVSTNINEQRVNNAAIRQGQDHAINQIDANKKRTGWEEGIFGQNIEYRAAQQRAATNAVNAAYLEQATEIDSFAGETPDEYAKRLQGGLDKTLNQYAGDKETKALVTQAWAVSSAKLAAKHFENHYAYNQQQQRETFETQTNQQFDMWTVDSSMATSGKELEAVKLSQSAFFKKGTKPDGMSDTAWRGSVNNQLMKDLREGNVGAYKAAENNNWFDSLNAKERVAMDKAISAYETKFGNRADILYEETKLAATNATSVEQASAIYATAIQNVDNLEARSTGSLKAKEKLLNTKNRLHEAAKAAYKAGSKAETDQARIDALKYSHRTTDITETSGIPEQLDAKPKELQDTLDMTLIEDVQKLIGSEEPIDAVTANREILSNTKIAEHLASRLEGKQTTSPLVKSLVQSFVGGFHNLANENGLVNEQGMQALASISKFEQNEETFMRTVGKPVYDKLQMIQRGIEHGHTMEMITKDLDTFAANTGNREKYAPNWQLGKGESKRSRIETLVNRWVKQTPVGSTLGQYMEDYDRALTIGFGDKEFAEQYLRQSVLNAGINYKGHAIANGNKLNSLSEYGFTQIMDFAQQPRGKESTSLIEPYLRNLLNTKPDDTRVTNLDQVRQVEMYTEEGYDGIFIDSQMAQQPEYIPGYILQSWAKELQQKKNFEALAKEVSEQDAETWLQSMPDYMKVPESKYKKYSK